MSNVEFKSITLERILDVVNLKKAYRSVVMNKGAPELIV